MRWTEQGHLPEARSETGTLTTLPGRTLNLLVLAHESQTIPMTLARPWATWLSETAWRGRGRWLQMLGGDWELGAPSLSRPPACPLRLARPTGLPRPGEASRWRVCQRRSVADQVPLTSGRPAASAPPSPAALPRILRRPHPRPLSRRKERMLQRVSGGGVGSGLKTE